MPFRELKAVAETSDISSVTAGVLTVLPAAGRTDTRRDLRVLCGAAIVALASFVEIGAVVDAREERSSDAILFAWFPGWQVSAVEVAAVALALALFVASAVVVRRVFRRLHGRTEHRRAAILVAILPGLALGLAASVGTGFAISWASDHTAAAAEADAEYRALFPANRPPYAPGFGDTAAPAELAARMIQPADIGAGWYAGSNPASTIVPVGKATPASYFGGVIAIRTMVEQETRVRGQWQLGSLALESMIQFPTAQAAAGYDKARRQQPTPSCPACPAISRGSRQFQIDGVSVFEVSGKGGRTAMFVVGNSDFSISMSARVTAGIEQAILSAAVRRAR